MINKKYLLLLLLLCMATILRAQNHVRDTSGTVLSQKMSISQERAKQILIAVNYRSGDISRLMRNKNIPVKRKQLLMTQLLAERKHMIDSVITPDEKQKLSDYQAAENKKIHDQVMQIQQARGKG